MTLKPWKKKLKDLDALNVAGMFFIEAEKAGAYNPEEDMILIPFNKAFGTDELNLKIANHLAKKRDAEVFQVVAGFNRKYFSVGDKVLYDKEDATIIKIEKNISYSGAPALQSSKTLDYWGHDSGEHAHAYDDDNDATVDFLLAQVASGEDRVNSGSHTITLKMNDSEAEIIVEAAGEINSILLGYCLTVHKSQGSEWNRVFLVFHQSHATMLQRELLYTAVTRAKSELYVICEAETFVNGIKSQRVKGDTLAEKAIFFQGRAKEMPEGKIA
jgi:ATP-dependent exoDNAse (exonuclease V) alpha subunit